MKHIKYSFVLYKGHSVLSPLFRNMLEEFVLPSLSLLTCTSIKNDLTRGQRVHRKTLPLDILIYFLSCRLVVTAVK